MLHVGSVFFCYCHLWIGLGSEAVYLSLHQRQIFPVVKVKTGISSPGERGKGVKSHINEQILECDIALLEIIYAESSSALSVYPPA